MSRADAPHHPDHTVRKPPPQGSTEAEPVGDGTYHLPAAWVTTPRHYDLSRPWFMAARPTCGLSRLKSPRHRRRVGRPAARPIPSRLDRIFPGAFTRRSSPRWPHSCWAASSPCLPAAQSAAAMILAAALVPLLAVRPLAHEDHDHGPPQAAQPVAPATPHGFWRTLGVRAKTTQRSWPFGRSFRSRRPTAHYRASRPHHPRSERERVRADGVGAALGAR